MNEKLSLQEKIFNMRNEFGTVTKNLTCEYLSTKYKFEDGRLIQKRVKELSKKYKLNIDIRFKGDADKSWTADLFIYDLENKEQMTIEYAGESDTKLANRIQGFGSTCTYATRYIYKLFFNLGELELDPDTVEFHKKANNEKHNQTDRILINEVQIKELKDKLKAKNINESDVIKYIADQYGLSNFTELDTNQYKVVLSKAENKK